MEIEIRTFTRDTIPQKDAANVTEYFTLPTLF